MTATPKPDVDLPPSKDRVTEIDLAKVDVKDITSETDKTAKGADANPATGASGPAPAAPVPPPVEPSRGGAGWPVVGGAVAGAIFGLLGANIHQTIQAPPVTVADPRVAQVEAGISAARQAEQRIEGQIKALEARAKVAEDKAAAAEQRAAQAEQKAAAIAAPLDGRIKAAEGKIGAVAGEAGALSRKIEGLGKVEAPKVDLAPLVARLDALDKALGANSARLSAGTDAASALDDRIKKAEQALNNLSARKSADTATATLSTTALVRRALEGGEAIGAHIAALRAQGVPDALLRPLAPYADKAAPPPNALATQLNGLAATLPKPVAEPAKTGGILERIKAGLLSQVDVRATGAVPADAAPVIARARARLLVDDGAGALAELKQLNAEQQAHLKPLTEAIAARVAGFEAVRMIEAEALAATARKS
ncbi:MAG: hypothetical protein LCH61_06020 [Proteobacteria bacterium]|nr:hypothetical protein [Pseudomonadota bacterium]